MKKKILILHTSIGMGHKYLSQNIKNHLEATGFEVRLADILEVQGGRLQEYFTKVYLWSQIKAPWIWSWFYKSKMFASLMHPLRVPLAGKHHNKALELIKEYNPDVVIGAQTTGSAVMSYLKRHKLYTKPFGIGFSDFHLHRFWLYDEAEFYLANIPEQKEEIVSMGFREDRVCVNGIPLQPRPVVDVSMVKQKFRVKEGDKVLLVSGGSLGFGLRQDFMELLTKHLEQKLPSDFVIIVVTGKDQELFENLSKSTNPHLRPLKFHDAMDELYSIADILVGKPGGLSTTEALSYRIPISVTHWMPGQEELNVDYLTKKRLTLPIAKQDASHEQRVLKQVVDELKTGAFRQELIRRGSELDKIANADPKVIGDFMSRMIREINPQA